MLEEDQGSIVENNLFAYCLNNSVSMVDEEGDSPFLALAGGGTVAASAGGTVAGVVFAPATMVVVGVVVGSYLVYSGYRCYKAKNKSKSKAEVDPYARKGQKNREGKIKIKVGLKRILSRGIIDVTRNQHPLKNILHQLKDIKNIKKQINKRSRVILCIFGHWINGRNI